MNDTNRCEHTCYYAQIEKWRIKWIDDYTDSNLMHYWRIELDSSAHTIRTLYFRLHRYRWCRRWWWNRCSVCICAVVIVVVSVCRHSRYTLYPYLAYELRQIICISSVNNLPFKWCVCVYLLRSTQFLFIIISVFFSRNANDFGNRLPKKMNLPIISVSARGGIFLRANKLKNNFNYVWKFFY